MFVGDPNLNLHLPLASWEGGGQPNVYVQGEEIKGERLVCKMDGVPGQGNNYLSHPKDLEGFEPV